MPVAPVDRSAFAAYPHLRMVLGRVMTGNARTGLSGCSLFAGIGGFDLAMERAGICVRAAAEIDGACREVLARWFPGTALLGDVGEVSAGDLRAG